MGHRPPAGIRPPQLEGKRVGRPRGVRNHAKAWADVIWGYRHRHEDLAAPPNESARMWWSFAIRYPDEVEEFLQCFDRI
jgi:hypothetical protein